VNSPAGVHRVAAPRLSVDVSRRSGVVMAEIAVESSKSHRTGKPCGRIPGSSADVAGIDEVGLNRVFKTGRCQSQHRTVINGNYCRKDIHGRNVYGSAIRKRLS